jgi:PPOX class probable F420-dependent enzyme
VIDEPARSMARDANFAAFTTMLPSGQPMTHVMWVDCDDEHLLINTETHRAKYLNVLKNPRVTVTIWDRNDPYRYAEVRGRVVDTVRGPEARRHIDELSMRYVDHPYPADKIGERVILKIAADRQREKVLGGEPPPPGHRRETGPKAG